MPWSVITAPLILAVLIFLVPGLLLALASGRRSIEALLIAPVLSAGVIGGGAVVLGMVGAPFNLLGVLLVALICSLVLGALALLLHRRHERGGGSTGKPSTGSPAMVRGEIPAVLGGLTVNLLVFVWTYASALSGPDAIFQNYDVPFHYSVITYLVETHNGSSFHAALVDHTIGSSFYPAGWHDTVALIITSTHVWLPVAVTASILTMLFLVLPLSVMALTRRLIPDHPMAVFAAASVCGVFGAFPVRFLIWGILYSNALSWCILPAAMAILVGVFQDDGHMNRITGVLLFFVAFTGVAMAQPNGVFTGLVLCTPLFMTFLQRIGQRFFSSRLVGVLLNTGFLVVLVVGWVVLHGAGFMHRTITVDWPAHTTVAGATKEVLTNSTNGMPPQYFLSTVVLIAAILWAIEVWRRKDRAGWPLAGLMISWTIYIVGSGIGSENVDDAGPINVFRDVLTGFWYHDQMRLAAIPVLIAIPLVGALFDSIMRMLNRALKKRLAAVALTMTCVLVFVSVSVHTGEIDTRRQNILQLSTLNDDWPLTASELAFMRQVRDYLPTGSVVLNNPYDGSAYGYSLVGLNTYFRSYDSNWIGTPTDDQEELRRHIDELGSRADQLCPALERNQIEYVLVMNMNSVTAGPSGFLIYPPEKWMGMSDITAATPGFEEVLTDSKGAHLYRITGCNT